MTRRPNLRDVTAREIREMLPDPDTLDVLSIPGKLRRELFRAMQQHDRASMTELCNAVDASAGNIVRDQYFQFAKMIDFPIGEWLAREQAVLDREAEERRRGNRPNRVLQTAPARAAKGKLAIATALLEKLGYLWHDGKKEFVRLPPNWE